MKFRPLLRAAVGASIALAATLTSTSVSAWSFDEIDVSILGDWNRLGPAPAANYLDMAVDADGNTYLVGQLGSDIDIDPTEAEDLRTAIAGSFLVKYDASGDLVWFHAFDQILYSEVEVASNGTVWIGGTISTYYANRAFDLDPSAGTAELTTGFYGAAVLTSFDNDGGFLTATMLDGGLSQSLTVTPSGDPVYAVSYQASTFSYPVKRFANGAVVDPADANVNAQSELALLWFDGRTGEATSGAVTQYGVLEATVNGSAATASELVTNADGDVIVGGYWKGSIDFDPTSDAAVQASRSTTDQDPFVAAYGSDARLLWVDAFNSVDAGDGVGSQNWILDVAIGSDGRILALGKVQGAVHIDGTVFAGDVATATLPMGQFLVLLDPDGTVASARLVDRGGFVGNITASGDGYYTDFTALVFPNGPDTFTAGGHFVERLDIDGNTEWRRSYHELGFDQGLIIEDGDGGAKIASQLLSNSSFGTCGVGGYVSLFQYDYLLNIDEFGATGPVEDAVIVDVALGEISTDGDNYITFDTICGSSAMFSITSGALPDGMTMDPATGTITGTPTATGPYEFTVSATNANGTTSRTFSGTVTSGSVPTWPADTSLGELPYGASVSIRLRADGGPAPTYTVTAGELPAGLTLDERTGVISGRTNSPGSYTFTVTATNANGSADFEFSGDLKSPSAASWATPPTVTNLAVGTPVTQRLVAAGAPAPVYRVTSGSLPDGVYLLPDGRLVGTPTEAGTYTVTLSTENSLGDDTTEVTIVVSADGTGGGDGDTGGGGTDGGGTGGTDDPTTGVLPRTGSSSALTAFLAAALVAVGTGLAGIRRRRTA